MKGCFWHATQDGVVYCIIRYSYGGINKVYFIAEVGTGFGQVALQAALVKAKTVAEDIRLGGDPQAAYKTEKQAKREREGMLRNGGSKNNPLVREKAKEYFAYNTSLPSSKENMLRALNEIVLAFGSKRISDVVKQDVIDLLLNLESRGAEGNYSVAVSVQKTGSAMWTWGIDIGGFPEVHNYFSILKSIRARHKKKDKERKMGLTETQEMADIHYDSFSSGYQRCILLQAYTAVRPSCTTSTPPLKRGGDRLPLDWSEFDLEKGVWHIPANRMKMRERAHIIDMPSQLLEHLKIWHKQDGYPTSGLVTRTIRKVPSMTDANHYASAYRGKGLNYTPHSWRANISTEIAEMRGAGEEIANLILAHYKRDTYIKTTKREDRKEWLQVWADKLDTLGFDRILLEAKMADQNITVAQ